MPTLSPRRVVAQQKELLITRIFKDPTARNYAFLTLAGGVVSSAAAERLYRRISQTESEGFHFPTPVVLALVTGLGTILYKANRAHNEKIGVV